MNLTHADDGDPPGEGAAHAPPPDRRRPVYQIKAEFFKTLGHPARIRILELLEEGERSVAELQREVGLETSHLSQQFSALKRASLVTSRREGSTIYYSARDTRIFDLLRVAREIITSGLIEMRDVLSELDADRGGDGAS